VEETVAGAETDRARRFWNGTDCTASGAIRDRTPGGERGNRFRDPVRADVDDSPKASL